MNYTAEEFDKAKTQVLKYILYQKRCTQEVRKKFTGKIEENMLEDIIEYLTNAGYINDNSYIQSKIEYFKNLKNLSIKEVRYKLIAKGIDNRQFENYMDKNYDSLNEYEIKSAYNILLKKQNTCEQEEVKRYLYRKGYKSDNINKAIERLEDI